MYVVESCMCLLVIVFYASEQSMKTMFWKFTHVPNSNICIHDAFKILAILVFQLSSYGLSRCTTFCFCDYDNIRASQKSFICLKSHALYKGISS